MPIATIRYFPDPILRQKADPVTQFDSSLQDLVGILIHTMRRQPSGIGIAAPQIGAAQQVAIVDVSTRVANAKALVLINPKILELGHERASREGCMSLPDYTANLKRYDWVRFQWQDLSGRRHVKISEGLEAVCVQHEVDHLQGILFLDRVSSLKRDMMPRVRRKGGYQ